MDSLSQFVLGSAVGSTIIRRNPKKVILLGGLTAQIPDLDIVLSRFYDPITFMTIHRSFSHSILCSFLLGGLLAYPLFKWKNISIKKGWLFFFMVFFTHILLDLFTTYGTQIFWPFDKHMYSINSISIVEPIYTSILLLPILYILFKKNLSIPKSTKIINIALLLSTLYLGWSYTSKKIATGVVVENLQQQGISYTDMRVTPTFGNTLLWQIVVKNQNEYYFSDYSLTDQNKTLIFHKEISKEELLTPILEEEKTKIYLHYCDNFGFVDGNPNRIEIYASKFGPFTLQEKPLLVFPFVAEKNKNGYDFYINKNDMSDKFKAYLQKIKSRIFN